MSPGRSILSLLAAVAIGLALGASPGGARADAMLTSPGAAPVFPTAIDVDVTVRAQVESTRYRLEFAPLVAGGSYSLTVPAPDGASPIAVAVDRGDGFVAVPVVTEAPASPAGGSSDGALVAWSGTAPLVAELRELAPGPLTVRVRFVRLLRRVGGAVAFDVGVRRCPARDAYDPGAQVRIGLQVTTDRDLAQFEATGGSATAVQVGVRVGTAATARAPLDDEEVVHVRYREAGTGIHAQLLAHRTPDADPMGGTAGYFLLLVDADAIGSGQPRAISMVLDRSGSMAGDKIAQARDAARAMLLQLDPDDRFTLHAFDDQLASFRSAPVLATPANLTAAARWIDDLADRGGTDLDLGLRRGLEAAAVEGHFDALVLLSDGMATSGETDDVQILANATARAAGETRIFTVSVGTDADFPLMEALARHNRGRHVDLNDAQARRELARRVRELFEDLHDVRLTDLELTVAGIGAADTLPEAPPDLYAGGQVVIVGRYEQPGVAEVRLRGVEGAVPFERVLRLDAPARVETDDIIRHVWATERVRALMASIAEGADPVAVRAQVVAIGLAYRIQTPYTRYQGSFPVDDPDVYASDGSCAAGGGSGGWLVLALAAAAAPVLARRRRA